MRTTERLTKLKQWLTAELCTGRLMKAPSPDGDITQIETQTPKCYLGWFPKRPDVSEGTLPQESSVCPGILVMPNPSKGRSMEEKRFDRYNSVQRPKDLGQTLAVSILFCVWEPGSRLPGFTQSEGDITLLEEGTEQGLFMLLNWLDDCVQLLLSQKTVPGTDLYVIDESIVYSLYADQGFVVDRRPLYYGFINVEFSCYADAGLNPVIDQYLT